MVLLFIVIVLLCYCVIALLRRDRITKSRYTKSRYNEIPNLPASFHPQLPLFGTTCSASAEGSPRGLFPVSHHEVTTLNPKLLLLHKPVHPGYRFLLMRNFRFTLVSRQGNSYLISSPDHILSRKIRQGS